MPWLIGLIVIAFWWPAGAYWQSDDYIAVHFTQSWERTLSDFGGAQYGLQSLVLFFRPLITLSFALEGLLGTAWAPFVSHLSNVVAHGISATCLALIVNRFWCSTPAWATGLVWGLAPCHASSVYWAVGRVDSHTTLWITLATLFLVQWCGGERRTRMLSVVCFGLALASKELAMVLPGIAAVFCWIGARPGQRVRGVITGVWPYLVMLAVYLCWRRFLFGVFIGGYDAAVEPGAAAVGLAVRTAQLLNPLMHSDLSTLPASFYTIGFVPPVLAVVACFARRQPKQMLVLLVLFVGCTIPMVHLWAHTGNPMILRNFYLPMMPLAALLCVWGWRTALPALAVAALPFCQLSADYGSSWQRCADWHLRILETVPRHHHELNFVAGLPRTNAKGTALEFHLGVDRLLRPPFFYSDRERHLFALRPISQRADVHRVGYGKDIGMPFGGTYAGGPAALHVVTTPPPLRKISWRRIGPEHLDMEVLDRMVVNFKRREAGDEPEGQDPVVVLEGVRSPLYRVTIFTANGYVTAFVPDTAAAGVEDGRVEFGLLLWASADDSDAHKVGELMQQATALDLRTRFPVLIEADTRIESTGQPGEFQATHANFAPVWLDLDRLFADWWP